MKKVVFASSSGGHLSEILKLESLFNEYDYLLVTEKTDVTEKMKEKYRFSSFNRFRRNFNTIKEYFTPRTPTTFPSKTSVIQKQGVGSNLCVLT